MNEELPSLEVDRVVLSRGGRTVLRDVSLVAAPGQILGVLGRNGAGKTTLLRALAGLQVPDQGEIRLGRRNLTALDRRERARLVTYVEQMGAGAWPIAARDLVALGRLPHRPWPAQLNRQDEVSIERALLACDALQFADRPIDTLSSGERSRVLLARALAGEPSVLLADEPVATVDPAHQLGLMRMLRQAAALGMVIVVVLHDLPLAARFCDRLALLSDGVLLARGTPQEVLVARHLASGFGIEALSGHHDGESFVLPWRELP